MAKNSKIWYNILVMEEGSFIYDILMLTASLETLSMFAAGIIGYIGVVIMAFGAVKSGFHFILSTVRRNNHLPYIRIELGKHLALGLEFLVGKDIIESIIRPSWDDLGKLTVIITLRIVVTLILSWEIREIKEEIKEDKEYTKARKVVRK